MILGRGAGGGPQGARSRAPGPARAGLPSRFFVVCQRPEGASCPCGPVATSGRSDQSLRQHARRLRSRTLCAARNPCGCSGLRYELAFDDRENDADTLIDAYGVRVVIDEKSALYLMGTTLDFVDTLNETGFKMVNPNASTTCGCGESFAA